ncbi:septum formation family protein [Rhizohabitans arisaemae]|uniref:septum formation family protein n=1 Tax=Rhizohabitans arisaemae TaxID=2720610 RepID=UPI0024B0BCE9|nr:septum formation family protein [Rhizohabitans arisaemae]
MPFPHRVRSAFLCAALVAATGCSGHDPHAGIVSSAAMEIGDCHRLELPEELYNGSDVAPPVPCNEPHQTETYMLTRYSGPIAAHRERPSPEQLVKEIDRLCDYRPIRPYLGAGPMDGQWGVAIWGKFPTRAEWLRGDRTLRCDLLGPTLVAARGPELTVPLRGIMVRAESAVVRRCRLGPADVTCAQPHDVEWVEPPVDLPPGRYPGVRRVARLAEEMCRVNAANFVGGPLRGLRLRLEPPGPDRWRRDDRRVECWLGREDGAPVVGTLRGGLAR